MKLKLSERVVDYFIQALFIFVSVFLAFWLNNYQAAQDEIKVTQKAKQTIKKELETNLDILKRNGEYHRLIYMYQKDFFKNKLDTLKYYSESKIPKFTKNFEVFHLTHNTLILANDTRINLEVENIVILNRLSEEIIRTQESANKFFSRNKMLPNKSLREKYAVFYDTLSELWLKEESLIKNIESTLQKLK